MRYPRPDRPKSLWRSLMMDQPVTRRQQHLSMVRRKLAALSEPILMMITDDVPRRSYGQQILSSQLS